ERIRVLSLLARAGELAGKPTDVYGVSFVGHFAEGAAGADVRRLALDIRGRMPADRPAVVTVIGSSGDKPSVVVALNDVARDWRLSAGELARVAGATL